MDLLSFLFSSLGELRGSWMGTGWVGLVYALDSRRRKKRVLLGRFRRGTRSLSSAVRIVKAGKLVGKRCCYLAIFFCLAGQESVAKQKK